MENCQYKNAAFLASKLNAMGGGKNDEDVFLQANAYFHDGQFRRALQSLRESTERKIPKHCQLAARCMIACDETEEALDFLNTIVPDEKAVEDLIGDDEELACVASSICVLKARVLELLETRKKASVWYKIALRHDIHCFEAYDALVEKHMLFEADERSFLNEISKNQSACLSLSYHHTTTTFF
jgi:anaphase-promoting complex subunit 6